jgi:hypothetical protein
MKPDINTDNINMEQVLAVKRRRVSSGMSRSRSSYSYRKPKGKFMVFLPEVMNEYKKNVFHQRTNSSGLNSANTNTKNAMVNGTLRSNRDI